MPFTLPSVASAPSGRPVWTAALPSLQVFQAYILMLADDPAGDWPIPEPLLGLGQNAWVTTTKKIK